MAAATVAGSSYLAATTPDGGALPPWAYGLIAADALLGAFALIAIVAASIAAIMWFLKRRVLIQL